jgi:hypothetical protein
VEGKAHLVFITTAQNQLLELEIYKLYYSTGKRWRKNQVSVDQVRKNATTGGAAPFATTPPRRCRRGSDVTIENREWNRRNRRRPRLSNGRFTGWVVGSTLDRWP